MGLLDRLRRGGDGDKDSLDISAPPEVTLDTGVRTTQLLVLSSALDDLVAGMRSDERQRFNPGWTGRIAEYSTAADRARELRRDGFDHEQLLDLCAEVRPLFVRGQGVAPDPSMEALEPQQDAVMAAVADLRTVRPSERPSERPA